MIAQAIVKTLIGVAGVLLLAVLKPLAEKAGKKMAAAIG